MLLRVLRLYPALALPVTFLLSVLSWLLIEKPALAQARPLGRRLEVAIDRSWIRRKSAPFPE